MHTIRRTLHIARSGLYITSSCYRSSRGFADVKPKSRESSQRKAELTKPGDAQTKNAAVEEKTRKSLEELDEELRQRMSGIAGDGGVAGVEYEDGKPAAMKRSVRNNMFRYI